jgi:ATP-dependent helicase/nuclease subunit B
VSIPPLFEGPAPRVRAIPASAPFLDVFVDAMARALYRADAPFALADALVLVPNRRAASGLIETFARRLDGAALLPTIRPLADLDEDVDVWGADPIALGLAPALSPARRRLELAALARARLAAEGGHDDPVRALAMADELCRLLDSAAAAAAVDWSKLDTLVDDLDLAAHWRASAEFLSIIARYWPERLAAEGVSDPAARRSALLHALASTWRAAPPSRAIAIAGSTGSVAATRALMAAVARLPRGVVVLPGLDADLDDRAWAAVDPQHPQFALRDTLAALGVDRRDVPMLAAEAPAGRARRVLMREALAPADETADWLRRLEAAGGSAMAKEALAGMSYVEAANAEEEAGAIALLMRRELEQETTRVALVTVDASLARRVEAKLARWNIAPAASLAAPLPRTPVGALITLLCELAQDSGEPIALAALIKHPLAAFGDAQARAAFERKVLRGARRHGDVRDAAARGGAFGARVAGALAPLIDAPDALSLALFADCVADAVERVAGARARQGRDGEAATDVLRDAIVHGDALGLTSKRAAARVLMALIAQREVWPESAGDPRCAILGPLEARLQRYDLMILGGLDEGVWPAAAREDPFLSRPMRAALGLAQPEARIGLAAHDFSQLACAERVVLTRARRRDGAPSVASRWIWRLDALTRGAGLRLAPDETILPLTHALDDVARHTPTPAPQPRPPAGQRLCRLSVTEVETLIRDPYAVYARRLLRLNALKPVGYRPGAAERGTAIHRAIEKAGKTRNRAALMQALDLELAEQGFDGVRREAERARLAASVDAFLVWVETREGHEHVEEKGRITLAGGHELRCQADRIEEALLGAAIIDWKSGAPPSDKQVKSGLSPQLLLEAAMLARGGFANIPVMPVYELIYWRFGGARPAPRVVGIDRPDTAAEEALAALETLLARYDKADQAFLSKPRAQFARPYSDYDLLARRKEWIDQEGAD